jgi:hypothetical protein
MRSKDLNLFFSPPIEERLAGRNIPCFLILKLITFETGAKI